MVEIVRTETLPDLPGLGIGVQDLTLDYGCSLLKMMYRDKANNSGDESRLKLVALAVKDIDQLPAFIEKNVNLARGQAIYTTGMGLNKCSQLLEEHFQKRCINLVEFDCFSKALRLLLSHYPKERLFYPLPKEEFGKGYTVARDFAAMERKAKRRDSSHDFVVFPTNDSQDNSSLPILDLEEEYATYGSGDTLPAIIAMCSSGLPFFKYVDHSTGSQSIDYSPRGGKTLMGLGSALTGAKTFDELMDLASKGNNANIDTYMKSLKTADQNDFYHMFPDDSYCFGFGNAAGKSREEMSREDLAAAAVMYVCSDVTQLAMNHALSHQVSNVILCGTMVTHPVIQKALTFQFTSRTLGYPKEIRPTLRICALGAYLGVIGAWISGEEQQRKGHVDS